MSTLTTNETTYKQDSYCIYIPRTAWQPEASK